MNISPYTATIDFSVGTQDFQVGDGTTAYKWNIISQVQDTSGTNVATFADGSTEIASAAQLSTAIENALGTATATDNTVLTSGTITVTGQTYIVGDVNEDTKITSADALMVLRYAVKLVTLTANQKAAGNVTHKTSNDSINSADALKILRYVVKLITSFD